MPGRGEEEATREEPGRGFDQGRSAFLAWLGSAVSVYSASQPPVERVFPSSSAHLHGKNMELLIGSSVSFSDVTPKTVDLTGDSQPRESQRVV